MGFYMLEMRFSEQAFTSRAAAGLCGGTLWDEFALFQGVCVFTFLSTTAPRSEMD